MRRFCFREESLLLVLFSFMLLGCSLFLGPTKEIQAQVDKWNCPLPTTLVTFNKTDFEIASAKYGKFSLGDVHLASDPQLSNLLSAGAKNAEVAEYLKCGSVNRGEIDAKDQSQVAYQQKILLYATANPTPDDWRKFFEENPSPHQSSLGGEDAILVKAANDLRREFHAVIDAHESSYKRSEFSRVEELVKLVEFHDQANGHALYYAGEVKRQIGMLEESHADFFRYLEVERTLPENKRGGDTGSEVCYKRAKGFCRQRTGWIHHLLANDFYQKSKAQKDSNRRIIFSRTALEHARASLDNFPVGFIQYVPTKTIISELQVK